MFGLHVVDLIVLAVYLLGITVLGVWMARRVRSLGDFFMPRRFGKVMMATHAFGTGTHSDQAVSVASKTFTSGLSGIWYQWLWLFATPFYWLIAPIMRRFRAITTADVFEARYDRSVGMLYAVVGIGQLMFSVGVMLKGSSAVIAASTGGAVPTHWAIGIMTVLFVAYGVAGGLGAAIVTDFVQGLLTVVFSFLLLPYVLDAVGGLSGLHQAIRDPHMFSLVAPEEIGLFYIVMIAFNGLVGIVTQPHTMGNCAAGRTEMDGRVGFMAGNFIKRICTIAWCLTGLAAVAYFAGKGETDPDKVYGLVAADFLPKVLPGLLGVFLASLLASVMSSCDSFMIASSGLFTENVYKPFAHWLARRGVMERPDDEHFVFVGRAAALGIVAGGVYFAFWLPSVVKGIEIFWKIAPMMGIAFWLGLFWRRMTPKGAWASALAAFAVWFLTTTSPVVWLLGNVPGSRAARLTFVSEAKPSPRLSADQVTDARGLALAVQRGTDPLATWLRGGLSHETRLRLSGWDGKSEVTGDLREPLLDDLNRLLEDDLYQEQRFAGVKLSERTRKLARKELTGADRTAFHRRLLEEALPGVIRPGWLLHPSDIIDPVGLARRLRTGDGPAARHVHGLLSPDVQKAMAQAESAAADELAAGLAAELNRIAAEPGLYDPTRFPGELLTSATRKLAAGGAVGEDLFRLNALLLEEAFPWEVRKNRTVEVYLPWQMALYLAAGAAAGIVVSLLTRPVPKEKLERFYALTRTPVQPGEEVPEPCTLPKGVRPAARRCITGPSSSLEIPVPTRTSVLGFLAGWALVAAIIAAFWWIARAP